NPGEGYFHELEDFHSALRYGGQIESTPEKALGDIETVFAMLESARLGEVINPGSSRKITQAFVLPQLSRYPGTRG
ncbi:MAG: hypothetical protein FWF81_14250, partial [Defluviitaleaceae bacterium]|nr:hypothetical protein [Defluviitaleaceae bacterium]